MKFWSTTSRSAPSLLGSNTLKRGIQLFNMHGSVVNNNYVEGNGANVTANNPAGFYSSIGHNFFVCNTSQDVYSGFTFSGASNPSWMVKNEMNTNTIGLYLSNGGVIGDVGSLDTPNDNIWVNNSVGHGVDGVTFANQNTVFYRNNVNPPSDYIPSVFDPSGMVRLPSISVSNSYDCPTENGSLIMPNGLGDISAKCMMILSDTTHQPTNHNQMRWMNLQGVYRILSLSDSITNTDSTLISYRDSCHNSNIGKIEQALNVWEDLKKSNSMTVALSHKDTLQSLTSANDIEENLSNVLRIILEDYTDTTLVADSTYLNLQTVLDSILPDSLQDSIVNQNIDRGFTMSQMENIRVIANKCPYTDGSAVYIARALLASKGTIFSLNNDSCGSGGSYRLEQPTVQLAHNDKPEWVKFYPNPAKDELTFELELNEGNVAKIEIVDILGSIADAFNLTQTNGKQIKSLSNFHSGTYIVKIFINEIGISNEKLVIIK